MFTLPPHLAGTAAVGIVPGEVIAQYELGDLRNFVYLILDWQLRKAAIVDPQTDLEPWLSGLAQHGFDLDAILLTHTHFDHVGGLPELVRRFPMIPVNVGQAELHRLAPAHSESPRVHRLVDGEVLKVGGLEIKALHTPGHSAGEYSYLLEHEPPYLLTGDTIFVRDCGRTTFPSGSDDQMFRSIQRIKTLPLRTIFLPGHHYTSECATTLERELAESAPFRCKSVEELAALP